MVKAKDPAGPWSAPVLIEKGLGLEDPCPLWDTDGRAYLVHAYAGSFAGIKSILVINKMNPEGTKVLDPGVIVYDGHGIDPTVEGPKLYKRHGYILPLWRRALALIPPQAAENIAYKNAARLWTLN